MGGEGNGPGKAMGPPYIFGKFAWKSFGFELVVHV